MRAPEMVFWLDHLGDNTVEGPGVLCRRHADAIVVPRNWTLDDHRDPDLHLFRPPAADPPDHHPQRRRSAGRAEGIEQLSLVDGQSGATPDPIVAVDEAIRAAPPASEWTPAFDVDDDLNGLLSAQSPVLSRAFRGTDRPRRP
jgi:hypothetical protein